MQLTVATKGRSIMKTTAIDNARPPKVYRIERDEKLGTVIIHVGVKWPAGLSWRLLAHCNLHSPTGFEVGYGGSGPADTAASILADYFEEDSRSVERTWRGRSNERPRGAVTLHQAFKCDVIAGIRLGPGETHTLDESQITAWLKEKHPGYLNPLESVDCQVCGDTLWREPDVYSTTEEWEDAVRQFNCEHAEHATRG